MPTVSTLYPVLPPVEGTRYVRPVQADTLSGIAQQLIHLIGWRGRIHSPGHVEYQQPAGPALEGFSPAGVSTTLRHWIPTTPYTTHLILALGYQAWSASGDRQIFAELYDLDDPGVIDEGCVWSQANGQLQIGRERAEALGVDRFRYPIRVAHTGIRVNDAPAAPPTGPRPLYVPPAARGHLVELRWSTTNARLCDFAVVEMFEAEL
jgi:hypothetical protein